MDAGNDTNQAELVQATYTYHTQLYSFDIDTLVVECLRAHGLFKSSMICHMYLFSEEHKPLISQIQDDDEDVEEKAPPVPSSVAVYQQQQPSPAAAAYPRPPPDDSPPAYSQQPAAAGYMFPQQQALTNVIVTQQVDMPCVRSP